MGVTEEAGAVASRSLAILGGAPMLFALVVVNFVSFGMITFLVSRAIETRAVERQQMISVLERCTLSPK
jgi:hypothetical protein